MRRAGEQVVLRVACGDVPQVHTVLCMPSGRRYFVLRVTGKSLHCRVMAPAEAVPDDAVAVLPWFWVVRRRNPKPAGRTLAQQIGEACKS